MATPWRWCELHAPACRSSGYGDSNAWAAYALKGNDPHYGACRPLFDDLRGGKRTVDVSSLVAGEVVQAVRREAARIVARGRGVDAPCPRTVLSMANEIIGGFFSELASLSGTGSVVIRRTPKSAGRYAGVSLRAMIRHGGNFEPHGKMGLIYRGLGMLDMMHALTARDYGVEKFCTRDRQFAALADDPEFDAINFVIF